MAFLKPAAVKKIHNAIERLFERAKVRLLGYTDNKKVDIGDVNYKPDSSLPGIFVRANIEEGTVPDKEVLDSLISHCAGYLDAQKEDAKSKIVQTIDSFLKDSKRKKTLDIKQDINTLLNDELTDMWSKVSSNVNRIAAYETNKAKNTGLLEGITNGGDEDPTIVFIGPNDGKTCSECSRLFFLKDGVTPRAWKLSEVGHGYHKRGDNYPKIGGLHPHCRHSPSAILSGYGFKKGRISFINPEHLEYVHQNRQDLG